jgi:UDPglucose 6-dehydrogenase
MYLRAMKVSSTPAKVAVIGLGKLGLPLSLVINSGGNEVIGFDLNKTRVSQLQKRQYDGPEPGVKKMLEHLNPTISFSNEINDIKDCSIAYVIVPTPSDSSGFFASNYVEDALRQVKNCWSKSLSDKVIVIVSTVMPGTTQQLKNQYFSDSKSKKIELIYSPEFIALGSVVENLYNPDSILIGAQSDWAATKHLEICESYVKSKPAVQKLNTTEAELAKILVNTFVTMKISFANFIGEISSRVAGVNPALIARAIGSDSRIGTTYLRPGLGFGGPCFPRDNRALIAFAEGQGLRADLAKATDEINNRQPEFLVDRIRRFITSENIIGVLGLSYKENSEVVDSSQGIVVANLLNSLGFEVICFDDYILERPSELSPDIRFTKQISDLSNCELLVELIDSEQNSICNDWQIPTVRP